MAASLATISELKRRDGFTKLWKNGAALQQGTQRLIEDCGIAEHVDCPGLPPWTAVRIRGFAEQETLELRSYFQQECIKRGILTLGSHMLSVAHDEAVIQEALTVYADVIPLLAVGDSRPRRGAPARRSTSTIHHPFLIEIDLPEIRLRNSFLSVCRYPWELARSRPLNPRLCRSESATTSSYSSTTI